MRKVRPGILSDMSKARQLIMKPKLEPRSPDLQFTEIKTCRELLWGPVMLCRLPGTGQEKAPAWAGNEGRTTRTREAWVGFAIILRDWFRQRSQGRAGTCPDSGPPNGRDWEKPPLTGTFPLVLHTEGPVMKTILTLHDHQASWVRHCTPLTTRREDNHG